MSKQTREVSSNLAGLPLRSKPLRWLVDLMDQARRPGQTPTLYQPPQDYIAGQSPVAWPATLEPIRPFGPPGSDVLARRVIQGQNLMFTPRPDAQLTAWDLKEIATYDLVRVIIENIKDVLCTASMTIQRRAVPGESENDRKKKEKGDQNILSMQRFFEYPDGDNDWPTWLRPLLDDMLVCDAPAINVRKTFNGDVAALEVIPGDQIVRYVDDNGRTPRPPNPAYAQLWEGVPRLNLTTEQLIYKPRNIVRRATIASQLYGMSPVEQAAKWCRTGAQRLEFQLLYYTEGSIPGMIQVVPPTVTPAKIAETMEALNSELAGNLTGRRQITLMQGFSPEGKDQILFGKEALLTDPFDDLLIRCLCFAFGVSPQRLMRMMNRASAQASQEAAEIEGSLPFFVWLKYSILDFIIQRVFGLYEYEVKFDTKQEVDVLKQAQADKSDVEVGIVPRNEARERRGLDPIDLPEMNVPMITAGNQVFPLQGAIERANAMLNAAGGDEDENDDGGVPTPAKKPNGKPNGSAKPNGSGKTKLAWHGSDELHYFYEVIE